MGRHKKKIAVVSVFLVLMIILFLNVGVSGSMDAGGALCISFDKWNMMQADKLIIGFRGETYTITDAEFIREFARETIAGSLKDYCCADEVDGWVEVYREERLVRRMDYISNHDAFAYDADIAHWVLFGKEGHAFLSGELRRELYAFLGIS